MLGGFGCIRLNESLKLKPAAHSITVVGSVADSMLLRIRDPGVLRPIRAERLPLGV